jgi:NAD(P)-dependent dehydrogenase (short-subunit alcohol dehydrogenase family)
MCKLLKDKVVVVTGGAGLIGKSFIQAIVENGGIGVIADTDEKMGLKVKDELENKNLDFIKVDITSKKSLKKCIDYLDKKYKKIDALVNNAYPRNKNYGRKFFDVEYDDFIENVGLNIGGYFLTSQQFAKYFKNQGYGNIINIASIYGVVAPRFEIYENTQMTMPVEYAAIKSAVIHLTKYMAKYFKGYNIRVNAISPGGVLNNQPEEFLKKYNSFALTKGMLNASDLKGTLIYLLSDMSKYVNGQNIVVDDGWSL